MELQAMMNNQTMTSLEVVELINLVRKEEGNNTVLAHSDFLKKVPDVIGEKEAGNFSCYYTASNGKQNPCYKFPKRESMLMAMSYSYSTQARLYDRWSELEQVVAEYKPQNVINCYGTSINLIQCSDGAYKQYASSVGKELYNLKLIKKQRKEELQKLRDYAIQELDLI